MTHYPKILWHFTDGALRDGRPLPPVGEWLISKGKIIPCKRGLHASPTPWDASRYAPGSVLHQVKLGGTVLPHGDPIDKYAGSKRAIVKTIDVEDLLRRFACDQALSVIHLWDAPPIVRDYLTACDPSKRDAARDAAGAAAWAATRAAARDAARDAAGAAAWNAAGDTAWNAAWAATWAATRAATRAAARDATRAAARDEFNRRVYEAFEVTR